MSRPVRTTEFTIVFVTRAAEQVWRDVVTHSGRDWVRRRYELKRGARIWYTVDEPNRTVHLLAVHTHHPNATK